MFIQDPVRERSKIDNILTFPGHGFVVVREKVSLKRALLLEIE